MNTILSAGSAFSLGTGIVYLWVLPSAKYPFWPHYLLLSFYIFLILLFVAVVISLFDPTPVINDASVNKVEELPKPTRRVKLAWTSLVVVMVILYIIFNGH